MPLTKAFSRTFKSPKETLDYCHPDVNMTEQFLYESDDKSTRLRTVDEEILNLQQRIMFLKKIFQKSSMLVKNIILKMTAVKQEVNGFCIKPVEEHHSQNFIEVERSRTLRLTEISLQPFDGDSSF